MSLSIVYNMCDVVMIEDAREINITKAKSTHKDATSNINNNSN